MTLIFSPLESCSILESRLDCVKKVTDFFFFFFLPCSFQSCTFPFKGIFLSSFVNFALNVDRLFLSHAAGFPGPADLRGASDYIVVGWDLSDLLWFVGPAESFTSGWPPECCRHKGRIIRIISAVWLVETNLLDE